MYVILVSIYDGMKHKFVAIGFKAHVREEDSGTFHRSSYRRKIMNEHSILSELCGINIGVFHDII